MVARSFELSPSELIQIIHSRRLVVGLRRLSLRVDPKFTGLVDNCSSASEPCIDHLSPEEWIVHESSLTLRHLVLPTELDKNAREQRCEDHKHDDKGRVVRGGRLFDSISILFYRQRLKLDSLVDVLVAFVLACGDESYNVDLGLDVPIDLNLSVSVVLHLLLDDQVASNELRVQQAS